jgi:predicted MPP superfamily phosphohydrolase
MIHLSDLHFVGTPGRGYHDFVADQVCQLQPDLFVFTGDLLDDMQLLPWATDVFRRMLTVAPGYFILGNHDWDLDHEHIREQISETGWINMVTHAGTSILIAGTEAPWIGANPEISKGSEADLRLLLSHTPDQRDYAMQNQFDLMLCGHNHGGQVVLPVIGPVYSPSKFGVRYAGGLFEHSDLLMHVSRGVSSKEPLRWNCLPEVTLLKLQFE